MADSSNDYKGIVPSMVDVEIGRSAAVTAVDTNTKINQSNTTASMEADLIINGSYEVEEDDEEEPYDNKCCCGLVDRESIGACCENGEHMIGRAVVIWLSITAVIIIAIFAL